MLATTTTRARRVSKEQQPPVAGASASASVSASTTAAGTAGASSNSGSCNGSKQTVRVLIRVRPTLSHERDDRPPCISVSGPDEVTIVNPRNAAEKLSYKFNHTFGTSETQEQVFAEVKSVVLQALSGNNATIFAYGQTGSGKTHTINGTSGDDQGIIPRTIKTLLAHVDENVLNASISAAYLEIYNEKIYDLLAGDSKAHSNLDVRQTSSGSIVVTGLSSVAIKSLADFEKHHELALKNRSTAATNLNEESSRSHFIMQLTIQNTLQNGKMLMSKLHIIDLAGSEDNKRTGNVGARMVESGAINKSLFVLGQVVEALNKGHARIPYRDSKVTRLLQDSLGGSAIGLMIACCAPGQQHYWDTYNTLNFALKSSLIKNVVVKHEIAAPPPPVPVQPPGHSAASGHASLLSMAQDGTGAAGLLGPPSRKQELLEWKQRARLHSSQGGRNPKSLRLSGGSNCSSDSGTGPGNHASAIPTKGRIGGQQQHRHQQQQQQQQQQQAEQAKRLDEMVRQQVDEQVRQRLAHLRTELLGATHGDERLLTTIDAQLMGAAATRDTRAAAAGDASGHAASLGNDSACAAGVEATKDKPAIDGEADQTSLEQMKQRTETEILRVVNTGTLKEIMQLKQIGKKRAEAIFETRVARGPYTALANLSLAGLSTTVVSSIFKANMNL